MTLFYCNIIFLIFRSANIFCIFFIILSKTMGILKYFVVLLATLTFFTAEGQSSQLNHLPGRNRAVVTQWLDNSLPSDESAFLLNNLEAELTESALYINPLFAYCDNHDHRQNVDCRSFVPHPGVKGDMRGFSQINDIHFDPSPMCPTCIYIPKESLILGLVSI